MHKVDVVVVSLWRSTTEDGPPYVFSSALSHYQILHDMVLTPFAIEFCSFYFNQKNILSKYCLCFGMFFSIFAKKNYDLWIIIKTEEYLLPSTTMMRIKIASKTCDLMLLFTFFLPFSIFHRFWAIINAADFAWIWYVFKRWTSMFTMDFTERQGQLIGKREKENKNHLFWAKFFHINSFKIKPAASQK